MSFFLVIPDALSKSSVAVAPRDSPEQLSMQINGKTYVGTADELSDVVDASITQIVQKLMPSAKRALEIARNEYNVISELIDSDPFVAHTLDLFTPGDLTPSADAIKRAEADLQSAEEAIGGRFIPKIVNELQAFQKSANEAIRVYRNARMQLTGAAENSVPVLEWTRDTSFLVLSVAASIYTAGGATSVAPAILATTSGKLGFQALIAVVQAGSNETGRYIAGSLSQNGLTATANIGTAFVSSIVIGAIFKHPKIQQVLGTLAYRIAPKLTPSVLGVQLIGTGTIKEFLKKFFEGAGKAPLQTAWTEATKGATGEKSFDKMSETVMLSPVSSSGKTLKKEFVDWMIKEGIAKGVITK